MGALDGKKIKLSRVWLRSHKGRGKKVGIERSSKGGRANMAAFSQGRGKKVKIETRPEEAAVGRRLANERPNW